MTLTTDIYRIKSTSNYLFVSMNDGNLRIYRNPAKKGKYLSFKLFATEFNLLSLED